VVEPGPFVVASEPVAVAPEPVAVAPEPVAVAPEPVVVEPEPVAVEPEPVVVEPEPVSVAPEVAVRAPSAPVTARVRRTVRVRPGASRRTSGGDRLVAVADAAQRVGQELAEALEAGTGPAETQQHSGAALEERLAAVLAFVRRRLTGDFAVDEFGFDPELTDTVLLNLFRPLYRKWFRVEVRGIENIPAVGGALVVANHSGAIAFDSLMTAVAVHDEHPARRHLRMLGADLVFSTPVLGELARKGGATLASNADAERLLSGGEVVAVWPEGFKGIGKPFSERYKLQRFGRGGFVSAALKTGVPIVPCAIVGAEETYPIIGNMPSVARLLGIPYAPVTPTWPLLGPLGLIPLPSKWLIEFCAPVVVDESIAGHAAAEDPMTVFDLTDQVRQTIQQTLYSLLVQRRSVFF
jgi:1-acyl-sn-glycerol-3-phosphate acyltransferase